MNMYRRTTVGLKLFMLFIAACAFFSPVSALAQQSEVDSLLNSSHVTSWAYFRDTGQSIWYISEAAGTTYGLGLNNSGHSSWVALANQASVANLDFLNKKVSLSSSTAALTPSSSYLAISLVGGEANQTVYGSTANQWANLIAGNTLNMEWYFFQVASTGKWYIVLINGTDSTILRLQLNAAKNQYDWQKPLDASGVAVDTSNWTKTFFQENGVWKVRFSNPSVNGSSQFLSFPLSTSLYPQGAYTPNTINTVLDHNMSAVYSDHDGTILSFTGELFQATAQYPPTAPQACYPKAGNAVWSSLLSSLYNGTGLNSAAPDKCSKNVALNYEAHPGYDYVATTGTPVYAAASGTVVNLNGGCVPKGIAKGCAAWGAIGIDHGNGYISQYLHLDLSRPHVSPGDSVTEGQQIALSGNTSPAGTHLGSHLHFEVLRLRAGATNDYQPGSYATVDPYGFDTSKGYSDYITTFNNNLPNICLWKGGCKFQ
ncbi:MAG: M23 family metallopeptidase [Sulfuricellaceae bacterium]|nr:M23 family metallopeptidase [Sulfuricellaceae bacterium]